MNGRVSKKLRKLAKRNWLEYLGEIIEQPLGTRVGVAWFILTHHRKEKHG